MARPKKEDAKVQVNVMIEPEILEEIDKLAKKAKLTRSHFMRNLILNGLEDARLLEKTGLLGILASGRDVVHKVINDFKLRGLNVMEKD